MPPKKPAAEPTLSDDDAPVEETTETKPDAVAVRKLSTHPSTAIMVKEALQELDSRKGVSSQAIQNYIKQKYPSVDLVRLKNLVRKALKKGLETGTLVRPANSTATGLAGRFRVAPKAKEPKAKTENRDPNVPKAPKPAKDGAKKAAGAGRKKKGSEPAQSEEDPKPPKKSKKSEEAAKKAPAKKTKAKKAAEKSDDEGSSTTKTKATEKSDDEGGSKTKTKATEESDDEGGSKTKTKATENDDEGGSKTKTKATEKSDDEGGSKTKTKATKKSTTEAKAAKAAKPAKPSKSKAAKAGSDAPAPRATGRRGKSAE